MEELFSKILQADVLTEDTKKELQEAFTKALEEAKAEARVQAEAEAKAEIAEQFVSDKEALVEAVDTKVEEALETELTPFKEDILRFRDLEVELAEKIVEARQEIAEVVKADMAELVEELDKFLEARLTAEVAELREDIEEQKKNQFGLKILETFGNVYKEKFLSEDETMFALEEAKEELNKAQAKLDESVKELKSIKREKELTKVLESLSGRPREVMEVILKTIPTEALQETYNKFIGKVLHENAVEKVEGEKSEKESDSSAVLAEGNTSKEVTESKVKVVTGDNETLKEERKAADAKGNLSADARKQLKKLAGIE